MRYVWAGLATALGAVMIFGPHETGPTAPDAATEPAPPPDTPNPAVGPLIASERPIRGPQTCHAATPDECDPPTTPPRAVWAHCEQWHDTAAAVGWPESDGPVLSYVMHRESRCNPGAYNRSGATGLLQILGEPCPPAGCRDATSNLAKGLSMRRARGWCPWVLRGDPVTGRSCG